MNSLPLHLTLAFGVFLISTCSPGSLLAHFWLKECGFYLSRDVSSDSSICSCLCETEVPRSWRTEAAVRDAQNRNPSSNSGHRREETSGCYSGSPATHHPFTRGSRDKNALYRSGATERGCEPVRGRHPPTPQAPAPLGTRSGCCAGPGRRSPRRGAVPLRPARRRQVGSTAAPPPAPAPRSPALRSFLFLSTERMTSALPSTSTTMVKMSTAARAVAARADGPPSRPQPGQLPLLPSRSMRASAHRRRGPSSSRPDGSPPGSTVAPQGGARPGTRPGGRTPPPPRRCHRPARGGAGGLPGAGHPQRSPVRWRHRAAAMGSTGPGSGAPPRCSPCAGFAAGRNHPGHPEPPASAVAPPRCDSLLRSCCSRQLRAQRETGPRQETAVLSEEEAVGSDSSSYNLRRHEPVL